MTDGPNSNFSNAFSKVRGTDSTTAAGPEHARQGFHPRKLFAGSSLPTHPWPPQKGRVGVRGRARPCTRSGHQGRGSGRPTPTPASRAQVRPGSAIDVPMRGPAATGDERGEGRRTPDPATGAQIQPGVSPGP
jgi:hypothetical protein